MTRDQSLRAFAAKGLIPTTLAFSHDDRFVAAAAGDVHVVRIVDGRTLLLRTRGVGRSRASVALVTDAGQAGDAVLAREIERIDGAPGRVDSVAGDELSRDFFAK